MKVRELIRRLQLVDENMDVYIPEHNGTNELDDIRLVDQLLVKHRSKETNHSWVNDYSIVIH